MPKYNNPKPHCEYDPTLPNIFTETVFFWPNVVRKELFLKNTNRFSMILNCLPLKESVVLH